MRGLRGFSHIELLVVIGIIVILFAILMQELNRIREQDKHAGCLSTIKQFTRVRPQYAYDTNDKVVKAGFIFSLLSETVLIEARRRVHRIEQDSDFLLCPV
jgi:competence protein ComGC